MPGFTPARTNEGWGIALLVVALAVVCWIAAFMIHRSTYHDPRDPLATLRGTPGASSHGAAAAHGDAAAPAAGATGGH